VKNISDHFLWKCFYSGKKRDVVILTLFESFEMPLSSFGSFDGLRERNTHK
jgi:hypothetical protein